MLVLVILVLALRLMLMLMLALALALVLALVLAPALMSLFPREHQDLLTPAGLAFCQADYDVSSPVDQSELNIMQLSSRD